MNETNTTDAVADFLRTAAIDLSEAREMYAIAEATLNSDMNRAAVRKYRDLCDVLESVGLSIAMVPAL